MNMFRAFMELSELHEAWLSREILIKKIRSTGRNYDFSKYTDAQLYRMWDRIRTERLKKTAKEPAHELDLDFEPVEEHDYCVCGARLSDAGFCPVCDGGEEDYTEALEEAGNLQSKFANNIDADIIAGVESEAPVDPIIGGMTKCSKSAPLNALYYVSKGENVKFKLGNIKLPFRQITHCWVEHNGKVAQTRNDANAELITKFSVDLVPSDIKASKKRIIDLIKAINDGSLTEGILDSKPSFTRWVKMQPSGINTTSQSQPQAASQSAITATSASTGKYIVTIVSDKGRLRAHATDGVHPGGWVAFPNNLRQFDGQQYEVDQLIWNGKNYRVAGNITEI